MKKKILLLFITLTLMIVSCFILNKNSKVSRFEEAFSNLNQLTLNNVYSAFSTDHPRMLYLDDYENMNSVNDLINKSDVIAKVQFHSRKQIHNVIETTVTVKECFKGDTSNQITIYEPAFISNNYNSIQIMGSNKLLEQDIDYLVCLIDALPDNKNYYNFINTILGYYPIKEQINIKEISYKDNITLTLDEIKNIDLLKIRFDEYNEVDKQMIKEYQNTCNKYKLYRNALFKMYLNM